MNGNKTENNTPLATLPNVLWNNEFKIKQSWQNIFLPRGWYGGKLFEMQIKNLNHT
jgi:hypothetical protein